MKAPHKNPPRPKFQFSLLGLFVLTLAAAVACAPGYYVMHGGIAMPQQRLVGMLMLLAGPLLFMTVLSIFLSLSGRGEP